MLGRKELTELDLQKQALVLESGLNRLTLQAEVQSLRSATSWVNDVTGASRELAPLLVVLAPIAGFLMARTVFSSRRSDAKIPARLSPGVSINPYLRATSTPTSSPRPKAMAMDS